MPIKIKMCTFVISTVRRPIGRPEGHRVARSGEIYLKSRFLDSASLRSPLGTPDGGNDTKSAFIKLNSYDKEPLL